MNLGVKLGKLSLKVPLVAASGTVGFGDELKTLVDFRSLGAITTKTITFLPHKGNPPPRIYETGCGVMNSVGLENPGADAFLSQKLPLIRKLAVKCIVSVGGFNEPDYVKAVEKLSPHHGVDALEINLSCPNLKLKKLISQSPLATYRLTKTLRKITRKPLLIKITPEANDIVKVAAAVEAGGADAVSLVNTFFSLAINIETRRPYLGSIYGGYSGPAIKPLSLYRVWKVAQNLTIPVLGGGGVENTADAVEFILAGATAVSLGTVNLASPNRAKEILKGIKKYLADNRIHSWKELKGGFIA